MLAPQARADVPADWAELGVAQTTRLQLRRCTSSETAEPCFQAGAALFCVTQSSRRSAKTRLFGAAEGDSGVWERIAKLGE